ncbi:MAG: DUF896 domain-containing protein [Lachnospiraceae bacterium]|jgi:uncharacterized protein YnzC (UPF0291/DUF896 family)|nr:DUF896 domain-containing protein [Lachnospiraceae bacterium]
MTEKEIGRINELYHKSKAEGLTDEEKAEQAKLRQEYILAIRRNLKRTLDQVSILEPDGSVTELKKVAERKEKRKKGS